MFAESMLIPVAKGVVGTALGIGVSWGGGYVVYKKYASPSPLQKILEERTGKSFSRSALVSRKFHGNGVTEIRYKIPSGLDVGDMLEIKPAIEDKLDCEVQVWSEDSLFVFQLSANPIPKELGYDPALIVKKLRRRELSLYLGKSRRGDEFFDFTSNATPHLLFGGPTGKGKSNLLNQGICGMTEAYTPEELQFVLIDLKDGVELGGYRNLPHVRGFYETTDQAIGGLELLLAELKRRNEVFKVLGVKKLSQHNEKFPHSKMPRILIIADEFAQFGNIAENSVRKLAFKKWEEVLQKGRSTGIHCLLGTQVTDADVFPKQIKGNIDARFGFGFSDPQHSKMITGGAELTKLPNIMGRGLFKLGDRVVQIQTPKIEEETVEEIIVKHSVEEAETSEAVEVIEAPMDSVPVEERKRVVAESDTNEETTDIESLFISDEDLKQSKMIAEG
jgi:DNA segregation ATPase FtsK/SpoIIIE, S-DNA-T family